MKKKIQLKIFKREIDKFCKMTKDNNILHKKNFYKSHNHKYKNIVVPGILLITKINQIICRKFQGAILLDLISNFKQPVYMNESNSLHHKIKVINKKNNLLELSAEIKNGSKIKAYFKINFITSKL